MTGVPHCYGLGVVEVLRSTWTAPGRPHNVGRPRDRSVCGGRMFSCLHRASLARMSSDLPSTSRWHTQTPHLSRQSLLLFTHGLLRRAASVAFDGAQINATEADADDGWAVTANRRRKSVVEFLSDPVDAAQTFGPTCMLFHGGVDTHARHRFRS
jgi:hypothetical protein